MYECHQYVFHEDQSKTVKLVRWPRPQEKIHFCGYSLEFSGTSLSTFLLHPLMECDVHSENYAIPRLIDR